MSQARGSAVSSTIFALCTVMLFSSCFATDYVVGDQFGWVLGSSQWANNKTFYPGDRLMFNYDWKLHNVVVLHDHYHFNTCKIPPKAGVYRSGHDRIALRRGDNFFVSSVRDDCYGMRMWITAY